MKLQTADDVQLLVEDMGWHIQDLETHAIVYRLETMNNLELKMTLKTIADRLWDETFDDQMGDMAKLHAVNLFDTQGAAITEWKIRQSK